MAPEGPGSSGVGTGGGAGRGGVEGKRAETGSHTSNSTPSKYLLGGGRPVVSMAVNAIFRVAGVVCDAVLTRSIG